MTDSLLEFELELLLEYPILIVIVMARVLSAMSVSPGTVSASARISYRPEEGGVHVKVSVLLVPFVKVMVWIPIRGSVKSV